MFKKFGRKIAVITNVLLFVQLAFFGLNASAGAALAVQHQGVTVAGGFATKIINAGETSTFTLSVLNKAQDENFETATYENALIGVGIETVEGQEIVQGTIESVNKVSTDRELFFDTEEPSDIVLGSLNEDSEVAGAPVLAETNYTETFTIKFAKPGTYKFTPYFVDLNVNTNNYSALSFTQKVNGVTKLTSGDMPTVVQNNKSTPDQFSVTLNNKYGYTYSKVLGKFTIKNSVASDIKSLEYLETAVTPNAWKNLPFVVSGNDLSGTFGPLPSGFPLGSVENTSQFRVVFNTAKTYDVTFEVVDLLNAGNVIATLSKQVTSDGKVDIKSVSSVPTVANDVSKFSKVVIVGNENISAVADAIFTQGTKTEIVPADVQIDPKTLTFSIDKLAEKFAGKEKIQFTVDVKDGVGNKLTVPFELVPDVVAPLSVNDLSITTNEDGSVTINWNNPNTPDSYTGIKVLKDGAFVTELPKGTTTYTDTNTEKGKTYSYEIVLYDEAGNQSSIAPLTVSIPAANVVAAVATDTQVVTPKATEQKVDESKEVKAESDEKTEEKNDEKTNSFPLWGLIILLILAGVGGYLYFSNENEVAPTEKKTVKNKK